MPDTDSELLELTIDNVAHGGVFVARHEGRVVFVADAIPGERVLARVVDAKSSFWRADTVEVLEASPDRVPHVWPAAALERDPSARPGGAEFGHIALERQRALKGQVLTEALSRFGRIDRPVEVEAVPGEADGTRWRSRVRLHVGRGGRVGPYAARSHTIVPVDSLPLATEAIEAEARAVAGALELGGQGAAAVDLLETADGELRVSLVAEELSKSGGRRGGRPGGRNAGGRGGRGGGRASGAGDGASGGRGGTPAEKPATIVERVGDREFRLAENGFWQVHRSAAQVLTTAVQELTREDLVDPRAANHDLYGGVGLLAAAFADRFGQATRITSVESEATATDHASENLAEWLGARAVTGRVDRYLAELERDASAEDKRRLAAATMVIDPPRSGAGKEVVGALTRLEVAQVVYVACDPVAFARDVAFFGEAGYVLDRVRAFDLFPHTHHLETVGVLVRG
ncbi:class I SAM-dependent RNA methyltransferase [Herbiconiux sp. VKM Ac-1786]|uniref:class I SAM-dependent RNA methyltransferase n=1 Tax=Herbiconiux sp. VKM Ac-1786 TaxID=2783824 RepID=UPI00188A5193|nr:class I SAM-dependent RNA methyltransferase [Herbiconiux sp. VKM Ac-1786]MBF4574479.1 class I SAM-dependent RNA methyltransferase [Herbiconiux sp. VKM Ac-1786]